MSMVLNPDPPGRAPAVSGRNRVIGQNVKVTLVHPKNHPGLPEDPQEDPQEVEEDLLNRDEG